MPSPSLNSMKPIERKSGLTRETFRDGYLKPQIPVILTDYADEWPCKTKWTIDFFKDNYGHIDVPVFSKEFSKPGKNYMGHDRKMSFKEYLELIDREPTDLRLFLFNIFKHAPELREDFSKPTIMNGFLMNFPLMFFGGAGSFVQLHYDIDMSHVFHTQFHGQKEVLLFAPSESRKLYQQPFTVRTYADIINPDYQKYPKLKEVEGYRDILLPGETLFMPSGYWHYMHYLTGGFAMSLRSSDSLMKKINGLYNIVINLTIDKSMNRLLGEKWNEMKEIMAHKRAG